MAERLILILIVNLVMEYALKRRQLTAWNNKLRSNVHASMRLEQVGFGIAQCCAAMIGRHEYMCRGCAIDDLNLLRLLACRTVMMVLKWRFNG